MLFLECLPDETLARWAGRSRRQCQHHDDKGRVCRALLRSVEPRIGMVDEDPASAQPTYLRGLKFVSEQHDVRLLEDAVHGHRLVIVCPRLEEWLIKTAATSGVTMGEFGLSERPNELHREINSKLDRLRALLDRLRDQNSPRLAYLQGLIES